MKNEFNPDEDQVIRVCMLVEDLDDPVEDSVQRECSECHRPVWFSTAQRFKSGHEYAERVDIILCGICGLAHILREGGKIMNMTDEPFEVRSLDDEIREYLDGQ